MHEKVIQQAHHAHGCLRMRLVVVRCNSGLRNEGAPDKEVFYSRILIDLYSNPLGTWHIAKHCIAGSADVACLVWVGWQQTRTGKTSGGSLRKLSNSEPRSLQQVFNYRWTDFRPKRIIATRKHCKAVHNRPGKVCYRLELCWLN